MRMSKNGSVVDFLNNFNSVINQLEFIGISFEDEMKALSFLRLLPDSWNKLVTTVSNSIVFRTLTLNDIVNYVMNDEMQIKAIGDSTSSNAALFVESRALVENEMGNKITRLKSENGGEYRDGGFKAYCSNKAAADTTVYTIDRSPASALNGGILEEEWSDDMLVASSSKERINELKKKLASAFFMMDLGRYIKKVLRRSNLHTSKPMTTPLAAHFKLSKELSPKIWEDEEYMAHVPYSSTLGSLMYAMISTRSDIAHTVGVVSRFLTNPGNEHWQSVKWILRYLTEHLGSVHVLRVITWMYKAM
ncbi:hypothetical protein RJ639_042156 [Escallonia herrerae]|uniref:Uncharacterized protein n=1 Tax=Escallonia herrerae TaxID=1293975 RepID=A0AA88WGW2_9ASTE|nr:hypothetical protein RJ639_042156 [Escallonia herrerae]